jgi:hypothetical protein
MPPRIWACKLQRRIYARRPGSGPQLNRKENIYLMKKLIKNIVAYFGMYGELMNSWNAVI